MYQTILFEVKDHIAKITLNRPEVGNALASESYVEIADALDKCSVDDDVRVVVITGVGKNFSAGGDIKKFKESLDKGEYITREGVVRAGGMTRAVRRCEKLVIAMINGAAAGAGCSLAMACDFRVMEEKSKLVMAFINMGFSGDTGGIYFLNQMIGIARTTEMMALAKPLTGKEAFELGVANRLAEPGKLEEETMELAKLLASRPTKAIGMQKKLYYEFFTRDLERFNEREGDYMRESSMSADHAEAVNAFLEKRKPNFTGK